MSRAAQRVLVQASAEGSVAARCQAVGLARSSYYYRPCGESAFNLQLMRLLDEEYTRHSFKGVLGMRDHLRLHGHPVNEKRIRRLLRLMGLQAVYPKPRLSAPGEGVTRYPYLLRERVITAPNEVWSTDITYIPMARGFLYLVAVLDWHSRYVLSWELSNTLDVGFCLAALTTALRQQPAPHIFNSDQGSQFTSAAFEQALRAAGCQISRDGRGRATDNAFVERLWRSVKWECVYLSPADDGHHLYQQLQAYFTYYNHHRPYQALKGQTPATIYTQTPTFNPEPICLTTPV
ncbi:putative transposase [Hymenobacter psychrotolerans DSM 18569]|uniref:Putative transposase n=1 Tax=Hymenobacter psychrotolerans DSM 18569 TaxID=1121959 RepID=A0A1M7EVC7_9BACT|nr:putative transposase [Hymenobacter psychrotolerans DSM 18569]